MIVRTNSYQFLVPH